MLVHRPNICMVRTKEVDRHILIATRNNAAELTFFNSSMFLPDFLIIEQIRA